MPNFADQAVLLVSHKCWHDYDEARKVTGNIEPEAFFDVWASDFMRGIEAKFREEVWRVFIKKLIDASKQRSE